MLDTDTNLSFELQKPFNKRQTRNTIGASSAVNYGNIARR